MIIMPRLFEAFLKCPTKCWLRSVGEPATGNAYADWVESQSDSYRSDGIKRLLEATPLAEHAIAPDATNLKAAKWRLAVDFLVRAQPVAQASSPANSGRVSLPERTPGGTPLDGIGTAGPSALPPNSALRTPHSELESQLHAVERLPSEGRGKAAQFIPIRFVFFNKLGKDDKLLLAFDAFALSEALGREIVVGKIIHGANRGCARESAANFQEGATGRQDETTTAGMNTAARSRAQPQVTKVKTSALAGEVRKRLDKIAALLANPAPPDLVLNRHCAECEFQARCRKIAVEKDDLSLLAGMSAKERQQLRSKGIFTVTQLSYTFRPRRRPKRLRDKREKYHHSLKALAIREKKIHIVGSPELKIEGTPVYLDVEALPDRDFYYLIGLRIGSGEAAVQHSLWADTVEDEGKIWREFLAILEIVEKPVLIHYGSYETSFLKQMADRHGGPPEGSAAAKVIETALNFVSVIFAQFYFPTYSNGLKEIGDYLGFRRSEARMEGLLSVVSRHQWVVSRDSYSQQQLRTYNAEDCAALDFLVGRLLQTSLSHNNDALGPVRTDSLPRTSLFHFGDIKFVIPEFDHINETAYWDYHRNRVRVRCNQKTKVIEMTKQRTRPRVFRFKKKALRINKLVETPRPLLCPQCGSKGALVIKTNHRIVRDLVFGQAGVKRAVVKYVERWCSCKECGNRYRCRPQGWPRHKEGSGLFAYVIYQLIEQRVSQAAVTKSLSELFAINIPTSTLNDLKAKAASFYRDTVDTILRNLLRGGLLHVDETSIIIRNERAIIWAFCDSEHAVLRRTETREGTFLIQLLDRFSGVLVSDFYVAYDGLECPQQKCLIHLMRDLNNDLLAEPFNNELKSLAQEFASLMQPVVQTIDRYGLKARYLRKHKLSVTCFYGKLSKLTCQTETSLKYVNRFEKNHDKLFTFLDYDGVAWHNNYAEHAIKAFALLRRGIGGTSTGDGLDDYLILLSIFETCKYKGVRFLDFLRSSEKDIDAFAESRRGRRRRSPTREPQAPPPDASAGQ